MQLTGDDNPVHVDDAFARRLGVGGRLVHGMLAASFVSTVIGTVLPGAGALWLSQRFNFRLPVRVDDRIRAEVTVRRISAATRVLVLGVKVENQRGQLVLDGEAQVRVLEEVAPVAEATTATRTVVVTGGSRGIGAAIARRLAADGLNVVVNYRTDGQGAERTVSSIAKDGRSACSFGADVTDRDQVSGLMDFAEKTYGHVDALVNNAGTDMEPRALEDTTWEDVQRHMAVHLGGSFHCVQRVLPGMIERGFGRIVNLTAGSAYGQPPARICGYVAAKAALAAFTRSTAVECGAHGVTSNAVAPGMTDAEMMADVTQRSRMLLTSHTPLQRLATVDDVAGVVSFLVGPGGSFLTGQTIHVSGGQEMS